MDISTKTCWQFVSGHLWSVAGDGSFVVTDSNSTSSSEAGFYCACMFFNCRLCPLTVGQQLLIRTCLPWEKNIRKIRSLWKMIVGEARTLNEIGFLSCHSATPRGWNGKKCPFALWHLERRTFERIILSNFGHLPGNIATQISAFQIGDDLCWCTHSAHVKTCLGVFRPSATVSRIGLMARRTPPPLLADPPPPRDGWLVRSAFALTKRTCLSFFSHDASHQCEAQRLVPRFLA